MRNYRHRIGNKKSGSTVVEAALILTIALMTFIGILDIGTVIFKLQGLTERARAGARWGVVNTYNAASIRNIVVYGNSAGTGNSLLGLSASYVTVSQVSLGDELFKVQVVINYPYRFFTPFLTGDRMLPRVEVSLTTESMGSAG